jgi:hypothetical protein
MRPRSARTPAAVTTPAVATATYPSLAPTTPCCRPGRRGHFRLLRLFFGFGLEVIGRRLRLAVSTNAGSGAATRAATSAHVGQTSTGVSSPSLQTRQARTTSGDPWACSVSPMDSLMRMEDDPRLGEPLCPSCYDARAQVLWNALAPELWRRTTIAMHRALARLVGVQEAELRRLVRVSYAKVAEFQRRGAIHFHAVLRLDAATECRCAGCLAPPPAPFTAGLLEEALRQAVPAVRVPCPALEDGGPERYARWGEQLDVRNITREHDDQAGELSAEQVAGYIAKYAAAMIRLVVAVGSDPVRHRRDAWPWICRPATATTAIAAVAWA